MNDVRRDDGVVQTDAKASNALLFKLFNDHRIMAKIAAGAAIFFRRRDQKQTLFCSLIPDLTRHRARLAPLFDMRLQLFLEELRHGIVEDLNFFVLAQTRIRLAVWPFVMNVLEPLMT